MITIMILLMMSGGANAGRDPALLDEEQIKAIR